MTIRNCIPPVVGAESQSRSYLGGKRHGRGANGYVLHGAAGRSTAVPSRGGAERLRSEFKSFTRWVKVYERIHGLGGSNALQDYESMSGKALSAGVLPSRPMTANVYTVFIASTRSGIARTEVSVPAWRTTSVAVPAGSST